MILSIISSFASAVLSLAVATMSIGILVFQKQIARRYGGYVIGQMPDMKKEERARSWINRLLWTTAILSTLIAAVNIVVAVLGIVGKS
jgi:ABC-type Fe3+ transport system permease subunit